MTFELHLGDCLETLRTMPDNSVDSIVTDPPYGLSQHTPAEVLECLKAWIAGEVYQPKGKGFMGKSWDAWVPGPEVWRECLRVLKPGGHVLAFAGTRSMDLMSMAIRLAGFELRDSVGYAHDGGGAPLMSWCFGSGFPKSLDVSKAIDKMNGETGRLHKFTAWMRTTRLTGAQINAATGTFMGSHYLTDKSQPAIPTPELWVKLRPLCGDVPAWVDELVDRIAAEREVVGRSKNGAGNGSVVGLGSERSMASSYNITSPATEAARQWQGWGTALKPAWEPIILARKPIQGTVAENVLAHGTGALNIDGCRVEGSEIASAGGTHRSGGIMGASEPLGGCEPTHTGRWPANLIHDGGEFLGEQARFFYCAKASKRDRDDGLEGFVPTKTNDGRKVDADNAYQRGATLRANIHPTVKPTDLMAYLCRLVTPPGGVVLDPFMGSGSTGKAAMREGFRFIGCEMSPEYMEIARARISAAMTLSNSQPVNQPSLFENAA